MRQDGKKIEISKSTVEMIQHKDNKARIFKHLWSQEIDSKEWIPPAYVARRAGTITLFLLGASPP